MSWRTCARRPCKTQNGVHPGTAVVFFTPVIDKNPGDMSCIFTTLHFVAAQVKRYNRTPVVTFDQPLHWKAQQIVASEPPSSTVKKTVVCLGTFHMIMSNLGSIGHLMDGSGLQQVMEKVYVPSSQLAGSREAEVWVNSRGLCGCSQCRLALQWTSGWYPSPMVPQKLSITKISPRHDSGKMTSTPAL